LFLLGIFTWLLKPPQRKFARFTDTLGCFGEERVGLEHGDEAMSQFSWLLEQIQDMGTVLGERIDYSSFNQVPL
jgi:hypothetical protein